VIPWGGMAEQGRGALGEHGGQFAKRTFPMDTSLASCELHVIQ